MSTWNAQRYLEFGDERTRPATDLVARIDIAAPQEIVDLGCGPGNSTQILRARWPDATICGIDNSPEMIAAARTAYPAQEWLLADISNWVPDNPVDLVFSNAALQWLGNHRTLLPRLFSTVADGGAFGFQIPSSNYTGEGAAKAPLPAGREPAPSAARGLGRGDQRRNGAWLINLSTLIT